MWITLFCILQNSLLSLCPKPETMTYVRKEQPPIKLQVEQVAETDKAVLVVIKGLETWLPKSQIEIIRKLTNAVGLNQLIVLDIEIPSWLYEKF